MQARPSSWVKTEDHSHRWKLPILCFRKLSGNHLFLERNTQVWNRSAVENIQATEEWKNRQEKGSKETRNNKPPEHQSLSNDRFIQNSWYSIWEWNTTVQQRCCKHRRLCSSSGHLTAPAPQLNHRMHLSQSKAQITTVTAQILILLAPGQQLFTERETMCFF